jgi:uncharacterized protein (TIGR02186 family)
MTRAAAILVSIFAGCAGAVPSAAAPPPLIADLSSNHIDLTTGFTGARLLLFGATESAGDIIVVVRGPSAREVVRRKERIAGIWVNRRSVTFQSVPGFYFDAGTRPMLDITSERNLRDLRIGTSRLSLPAVDGDPEAKAEVYREALLRLKRRNGLYSSSAVPVKILGDRLFRVEIVFPANVRTGSYTAEVYLFRQGRQISVDRKTLSVRRAGAEAAIYDFAHQHSAIYGIVAIIVALFAGWLAGVIFRKV